MHDRATTVAVQLMGGVEQALTHAEYFSTLASLVRQGLESPALARWTQSRLTVAEIVGLASDVTVAEEPYSFPRQGNPDEREMSTQTGKSAVTLLYLRGFEPDEIATILAFPPERVGRTLAGRSSMTTPHERTVVEMFLGGCSVMQIADRLHLSRPTCYAVLERGGFKVSKNLTPQSTKDKIVKLRNDGADYERIRLATGASDDQIKNTLRAAAKAGKLTSYGRAA